MNETLVTPKTSIESINLIDGVFTHNDAADIIYAMLDKKINFHKIQRLKISEGNHDDPCSHDTSRLEMLLSEKKRLQKIFQVIRSQPKRIKIKSKINIEILD